MKYRKFLDDVEKEKGIRPSHAQISNILDGKPTANALGNRYFNDGDLKAEEYIILANYFNLESNDSQLSNNTLDDILDNLNNEHLVGKFFNIPYWEAPLESAEKIKKATITDGIPIALEIIINEWGCNPQDLRIIAMPGDEMNASKYPLRNKDILVIDTSQTDISDSGVYLLTTNNCETIAVRRLVESLNGSVIFSVDNEDYAPLINRTMTREELKEIDFKVIGRVVKNISFTFKDY